ncbi:MAG: hypothetical protein AAFZ65_05105 [Planctomycetota bacterium]
MDPTTGFLFFLGLTVVLLGAVAWTGFTKRIALHIPLVVASVASLGGAIVFALRLGDLYDLESAGLITPVHLTLAKVATAAYVLPLVTGVQTMFDRERRHRHKQAAFIALGLTLAATATGAWMLLAAERL